MHRSDRDYTGRNGSFPHDIRLSSMEVLVRKWS